MPDPHRNEADAQKQVWDRLWSQKISYHWDPLSQTVYDCIRETIGDPSGRKVLEAGSGTGKISLRLAMDGAFVTLVDYSSNALEQSGFAFRQKDCTGQFVLADIRSIPLRENTFDLTWSSGVLEHFSLNDKVKILKEMARVTKPDGIVLVLVPNSRCLVYRMGKAYAESQGTWRYGHEVPVESLREEFRLAGIELERETDIGFVQGMEFLDFIPGTQILKMWAAKWHQGLSDEDKRTFPGYLLSAAGRVKAFDS
jgi:SAM-dependent methyltransferase